MMKERITKLKRTVKNKLNKTVDNILIKIQNYLNKKYKYNNIRIQSDPHNIIKLRSRKVFNHYNNGYDKEYMLKILKRELRNEMLEELDKYIQYNIEDTFIIYDKTITAELNIIYNENKTS